MFCLWYTCYKEDILKNFMYKEFSFLRIFEWYEFIRYYVWLNVIRYLYELLNSTISNWNIKEEAILRFNNGAVISLQNNKNGGIAGFCGNKMRVQTA